MAKEINTVTGKKKINKKEYLLYAIIVMIVVIIISLRAGYIAQTHNLDMYQAIGEVFKGNIGPQIALNKVSLSLIGIGLFFTAIFALDAVTSKELKAHYNDEKTHGVEHFMSESEIKKFNMEYNEPFGKDYADSQNNTILAKNVQISMNASKTGLGNNNMLIIGGPGSGKSFNVVRPNLLQAYGSYVVTDPSGELLATTGKFFEEQGYDIKVFNLVDMTHSNCYNPFNYINTEEDMITMIDCLINSTEGDMKGGDPFWRESMTALYEALGFYLVKHEAKDKHNFSAMSNMLRMAKTEQGAKDTTTQLDKIFNKIREEDPNDLSVKQYDIFKQAGDKTAQSILITAAVKLQAFNLEAVINLTSSDDIGLKDIGDKKTIVFIIVPQGSNSYAFLVNMMYTQMFDSLYYHAANDCPGLRLKYDVRFMLDEFANIGKMPAFQTKLTTMRKYGLSCMIFIQAVSQIKQLYKDDWETLVGACTIMMYLGGNELSSMEDIVKKLGSTTIKTRDMSQSRSNKGGNSSVSYKYQEKQLMTVAELRRLRKGYCIILIQGLFPFYEPKYNTTKHPNAKYLGNLGSGERLYTFALCNTKPVDIEKIMDSVNYEAEKRKTPEEIKENITQPAPINQSNDVDIDKLKEETEKWTTGSVDANNNKEDKETKVHTKDSTGNKKVTTIKNGNIVCNVDEKGIEDALDSAEISEYY